MYIVRWVIRVVGLKGNAGDENLHVGLLEVHRRWHCVHVHCFERIHKVAGEMSRNTSERKPFYLYQAITTSSYPNTWRNTNVTVYPSGQLANLTYDFP